MTQKQYDKISHFYIQRPKLINMLKWSNKLVTLTGYLVYPMILAYLYNRRNSHLISYILIPAIGFLLVSVFRKVYNKPRPYENPQLKTLSRRDKEGESFPSRHVFSYALIAVLLWSIFPIPGGIMILLSFLLAYLRVVLGVHYPIDVMVGGLLGLLFGILTILI